MSDTFKEGKFYSEKDLEQRAGDALASYEENAGLTLSFIPVRQLSYRDDNGFGTYICEVVDDSDCPDTFISKGSFIRPLDVGHSYEASGIINTFRDTKQFKINEIKKIMPTTKRSILTFMHSLNNMRFQAEIIYDKYGNNSLRVIQQEPQKIVDLLPTSYMEQVLNWKDQIDNLKDDYNFLLRLMEYGIKSAQAKELYEKYGELVFDKIESNPYFLAKEIRGYSFTRCDNLAMVVGISPDNPSRLSEGIMHLLNQIGVNGDTCIQYDDFVEQAQMLLSIKMPVNDMKRALKEKNKGKMYEYTVGKNSFNVDYAYIEECMENYKLAYTQEQKDAAKAVVYKIKRDNICDVITMLDKTGRIVIMDDKIFDQKTYNQELMIAHYIKDIQSHAQKSNIDTEKLIDKYLSVKQISLEEKQKEAVLKAISYIGNILIINGAAGCGKTFCVKTAIELLKKIYEAKVGFFNSLIIAPTGKAAIVAQKATGMQASTIHKALQYKPLEGFTYNARNKLPYHCIVIDEFSMVDTELAHALFSAISPKTKVIIMGDVQQLASIGPGNVFRDMIDSRTIDVVTLNVIKRQGIDSGTVTNARNIINGEMVTSQKEKMDSLIYQINESEEYEPKILKLYENLSKKYKLSDIQVLTPQKTGITGVNYLNFILQEKFNPENNDIRIPKRTFEVKLNGETEEFDLMFKRGDKVINTRNNYTIKCYDKVDGRLVENSDYAGVTNGETGIIVKITQKRNEYGENIDKIIVRFDNKYVIYEDFEDLELAYSMTIHKSQGSEWKAVILALSPSHKNMIDRNLLYTGITRAKAISIIISDKDTLAYGIKKQRSIKRLTGLQEQLREGHEKG